MISRTIEGSRTGVLAALVTRVRPKHTLVPLLLAVMVVGITPLCAQAQNTNTQSSQGQSNAQDDQANPPIPGFFDSVVVTATREKESTREVSNNVTILDSKDIMASTAQTVADLLVEQGFNSVSYNDSSGVQIRGFGQLSGPPEYTNTVLIVMDGRRTGNANLTLTSLENVERIEIIRGPSAVQYGSSAMGGVINIITRHGTATPTASAELGVGSDDLKREKLSFSGAAKGFDIAFGVSNYGRGDLTTSGGIRWYHTAIANNSQASVDAGYTVNDNNRVGIFYNFGTIHDQLASASSGIFPYTSNTPTSAFSAYEKKTYDTSVYYTGTTSNKSWNWSTNYSFGHYDTLPFTNFLGTKFFNAQAGYNHSLFSVSFGADDYVYENIPSTNSPAPWSMKDNGVYATGKIRMAKDTVILSSGVRYDAFTNASSGITANMNHSGGSVGLAYLPARWLKLRTNYAEGFKMAAPTQVSGDGLYYLPSLSLLPEKSNTYEFGGDVDWKFFSASTTWFHSDWDNKISAFYQGSTGCSSGFCYQYVNLKSAVLAGLEGSLNVDVAKALNQRFSLAPFVTFTWLQSRLNQDTTQFITFNGVKNDTIPNTPAWMTTYGIAYANPGLKLNARLNAAFYGNTYTTDYSQSSAPYIIRPSGTVVNFTFDKELAGLSSGHDKVALRAEIVNLLDGANMVYWGYPGPGRSFYVGARYTH